MFKIVALICSVALQPSACTEQTADDVVARETVESPMRCAFLGQSGLAPTALAPQPGKQYLKILCQREARADNAR